MSLVVASSKKWNEDLLSGVERRVRKKCKLISDKEELTVKALEEIDPEYIFFPHWSFIIPPEIYNRWKCVVFHMTDLPFGRGGSPLQNLISRRIYETKLSAIRVDDGIDTGDIYSKRSMSLYGTAEEIYLRSNDLIEEMIVEIIENGIVPTKQSGDSVFFKRRTPEMSDLEEVDSLRQLFDQIRMLDAEGYPHAYIGNNHFKFEFTRASLKSDSSIIADVRITKK